MLPAAWVSIDCRRETVPTHGAPGWFARGRWPAGMDGGYSPIRTALPWRHVVNGHEGRASTSSGGSRGVNGCKHGISYAHNLLETCKWKNREGRLGRPQSMVSRRTTAVSSCRVCTSSRRAGPRQPGQRRGGPWTGSEQMPMPLTCCHDSHGPFDARFSICGCTGKG